MLDKINLKLGTNITISDIKTVGRSVINFAKEVYRQKVSDNQFIIQLKKVELQAIYEQLNTREYTYEQKQHFLENFKNA